MQRFVLVLCALLVAADAEAFCRLTTAEPSAGGACSTSGRGLAWQRQCISYTVVPREQQGIDLDAIRNTIDDSFEPWIRVACGNGPLPIELGQTQALGGCLEAEYNQYGPNANTIMFLSEWEGDDFPREAFGLTLVWHDPQTGEIFDADMQLNETIAPIAICDGGCSGDVVDLSNVVTHEAGHFLGLGHTNVLSATLEQDDMDGMCSIYASNTAPVCDEADFAPDRGFSPHCAAAPKDTSCSVGAVGSQHEPRDPLALAGAALALLWLYRRRRS
jgi:MYXO-CTERM domain-containing protein